MAYFRDITILHNKDDTSWASYLLKKFDCPNLDISIHSIDIDDLQYENPPEIEASVRESYALVLLVTGSLVAYMENNARWFSKLLEVRNVAITTVYAAMLCVDKSEFQNFCDTHDYQHLGWSFLEVASDGSKTQEVVLDVLQAVDNNREQHEENFRVQEENSLNTIPESCVCEFYPGTVKMKQDKIAVVFTRKIEGEVSIAFDELDSTVSTVGINPFCVSFIPPALPQGLHTVHILEDGEEIQVLPLQYCCVEFTSVELMRQFFGLDTMDDLDKLLSLQYRESMCTDESLKRLINLTPQQEIDIKLPYCTALHWAASNGLKELVSQMLMSPRAVEICEFRNCYGETVSDMAKRGGHTGLSTYIDEFIDTKRCADVCDLYVQASTDDDMKASSPVQENDYLTMTIQQKPELTEDSLYIDMSKDPAIAVDAPPPLPKRGRTKSAPDITKNTFSHRKGLPTPHQFLQIKTEPKLKEGAVGCRSQNELIDIQDDVKAGTFTVNEAVMLFNAWKERYQTGSKAVSFKDKQNSLLEMRQKYKTTLSLLTKATNKSLGLPTTVEERCKDVDIISDPIVKRQEDVGSRHRRREQKKSDTLSGASVNSNTFRSSHDSGYDVYHDDVFDSDCFERKLDHRKSLANAYMTDGEDMSGKPPLPPRSYQKKPPAVYCKKKK